MSETSNRHNQEDQRVFALHHHVQRTITHQLRALYPPMHDLSPKVLAKLAKLSDPPKELVPSSWRTPRAAQWRYNQRGVARVIV